jgi:hypothetical protein
MAPGSRAFTSIGIEMVVLACVKYYESVANRIENFAYVPACEVRTSLFSLLHGLPKHVHFFTQAGCVA